jgi:trk system potassium uptake protein TrkH
MLPCVIIGIVDSDRYTTIAFIETIAILIAFALLILFGVRASTRTEPSVRDSFLLVFTAWVGIAFASSLPFYFSGATMSFADAFFEAASGVSATGATIFDDIEAQSRAILLWRSLCHWMGGIGIILLTVALLPLLGIGGLQLIKAELGVETEKLTSRAAQTAKYLWIIYATATLITVILYLAGGMGAFDAFNHAFSAIATGGFSTKNSSMIEFSPYLQWVTTIAMCAGGISFALYYRAATGRVLKVLKNTELRVYLGIIAVTTLITVLANMYYNTYTDLADNIRHSAFQIVSIITTAGFATTDYMLWPHLSQFMLFTLLFIGGCSSSTAGGIKVIRIVVIFKQALIEMKHLIHPRGVFMLRLNGSTTINKDVVYSVVGYVILHLFTVMLVAALTSFAGADLSTAFSTGLATVGNTGLGMAGIGPAENYSFYPEYVKYALGFAMIIGRLELYTFFVLLTPFFWKR